MSNAYDGPVVLKHGVVYRNPVPYLRSVHAWHPSLSRNAKGRLVVTFDLGEAVESLDYRTYITRSKDEGLSWDAPEALVKTSLTNGLSTHSVRTTRLRGGRMFVGLGAIYHRNDPETGLINRVNLGCVPIELFLMKQRMDTQEGMKIKMISPALKSPGFELCHPVIELKDGRWLAPTSTWKGWNGEAPSGMKAVALVSHDEGETWPEYITVADQYARGVISWEQSMVQLEDGRLLAVVWSFNEGTGLSEPTRYTVSEDGKTFGPLMENGILGQTAKMVHLGGNRVFMAYRRDDKPGLWGALCELGSKDQGNKWTTLAQTALWEGAGSGMKGRDNNANELSGLKFGYPSLLKVGEDEVMVVFWAKVDEVYEIRWVKVGVPT
jgi:sialidase-1